MQNKIATITLYFWVLKVLATTLGETSGDMLAHTLKLGYTTGLFITGFILLGFLFFQVRAKKYHPALFWAAIIGTTTVGTEISDFMDRTLGLGYLAGSLLMVSGLMITLAYWYSKEKTLQVYSITHTRTEILFWVAVLFSNSLGTAFGDYLTDDLKLSYVQGALVTSAVIGGMLLLHYATRINQVLVFWLAFIFTRPFGATFGDLLTKPNDHGGFDLGTIQASLVTIGIFIVILLLTEKQRTAQIHRTEN